MSVLCSCSVFVSCSRFFCMYHSWSRARPETSMAFTSIHPSGAACVAQDSRLRRLRAAPLAPHTMSLKCWKPILEHCCTSHACNIPACCMALHSPVCGSRSSGLFVVGLHDAHACCGRTQQCMSRGAPTAHHLHACELRCKAAACCISRCLASATLLMSHRSYMAHLPTLMLRSFYHQIFLSGVPANVWHA
ncbi:hypothetical protein COO60DRAFT_109873 [Scenedesmus sp. NREL 46B-D3]|nr:hypothetical protein COO60DRAFT_109873 [Scenedesmus sp. NREL 46B-D3]